MKITFIGLGIMGSRMAKNLLKKQKSLTVFNRSDAPMQVLKKSGALVATSYKDAVQDADIVFTMLSTPDVVEAVALSETGFVHEMKANAIWVDCSTVDPAFSKKAADTAKDNKIRFIDAPVSGTKPNAERGDLIFYIGGEKDDLLVVEPFLKYMGNKVVHVGETGKGTAYKMLVNSLLAQSMLMFSETVLLGEKLGLSKDFLLDTLAGLGVSAPFLASKTEMIRSDNYEVQFPLEWMHKDLHLVTKTAYENNQPLYLANVVKEFYANAKQRGLGREDFAAVYKFLDK